MPWSEADRAKYHVIRERYSSDLSESEFALIFPLLPAPKRRGRKPTCAREILNALFYLIRAGCPWRLLPKDFPPFTTVQVIAQAVAESGVSMGRPSRFRMAWRGPIECLRAVSMTALMSAYCLAPHWERNPLVIFR